MPTYFFKVVLCEIKNGAFELFSYVMPNAYCHNVPLDVPLDSYLVPIDSIEKASGFLLFNSLLKKKDSISKWKKDLTSNFIN